MWLCPWESGVNISNFSNTSRFFHSSVLSFAAETFSLAACLFGSLLFSHSSNIPQSCIRNWLYIWFALTGYYQANTSRDVPGECETLPSGPCISQAKLRQDILETNSCHFAYRLPVMEVEGNFDSFSTFVSSCSKNSVEYRCGTPWRSDCEGPRECGQGWVHEGHRTLVPACYT